MVNLGDLRRQLSFQRRLSRRVAREWRGKAVFCHVGDARAFFSREHLASIDSDLLLKAFKVRFVSGGALLYRRKKLLLSPEEVLVNLRRSFPSIGFFLVDERKFLSGEEVVL